MYGDDHVLYDERATAGQELDDLPNTLYEQLRRGTLLPSYSETHAYSLNAQYQLVFHRSQSPGCRPTA